MASRAILSWIFLLTSDIQFQQRIPWSVFNVRQLNVFILEEPNTMGVVEYVATLGSVILLVVTMPFSLFFCFKVSYFVSYCRTKTHQSTLFYNLSMVYRKIDILAVPIQYICMNFFAYFDAVGALINHSVFAVALKIQCNLFVCFYKLWQILDFPFRLYKNTKGP